MWRPRFEPLSRIFLSSTRGRVAQPGRERLSNKQDVAGSNPASPIPRRPARGRSSVESGRLKRGASQVRLLPTTFPFGPVAQCRAADSYSARCRFDSCRGHRPTSDPVWSSGRTRDCYSRKAGSTPAAGAARRTPPWSSGDDARLSTGRQRVRLPPGVSTITPACREAWPPRRFWEPETAGSTPARQTCAVGERLSSRAS